MNFSMLGASDRRVLLLGAVVAIMALVSFMDPSGSWGVIMVLALLGGLGTVAVVLWPQLSKSPLPAPRGLALLALGGAAALAFLIAGLTYLGYVFAVTRVFSILFDVGLVASIALAYYGWLAYRAEQGSARAAAAPAAPVAPAATVPPPPAPTTAPPAPAPVTPPPPPPPPEGS